MNIFRVFIKVVERFSERVNFTQIFSRISHNRYFRQFQWMNVSC